MKHRLFTLLLVGFLLLTACTPQPAATEKPTDIVSPPGPTNPPAPTETVPAPTPTQASASLSPAESAAIQALSKKNNIPADQIKLINAEAMSWPTGCLGIVLPGVMCTKGPVDGFRILLEANGEQFEYHTNQDGTNVIDAAQQLASIRLVVSTSNHTVQLVDPNIPLGSTYNPAFNGFLSSGESIAGTAYVLDFTNQAKAEAVDVGGAHDLSFIQNPNYALAVWRGGLGTQPRLAWGTQPDSSTQISNLQISAPDGSQLETLLSQDANANPRMQLVAELWSADGQSLYFSKEPWGIGGYIVFGGASNLYNIDIATKKVTELIPAGDSSGPVVCLDAISGDYRFVADHCSQKTITVRDLTTGASSTIEPPTEVTDFGALGSARFSPDGKRVAFALAKRNLENEQGWVAVSDSTSGGSKLILTGQAGSYYTIAGWLDDQTLLIQVNSLNCNPNCENQLWTVGADGSNPVKVADGSFLTLIDNR